MAYTLEKFRRDAVPTRLNSLTPEEILTHYKPERLLSRLTPEERLSGLTLEERLAFQARNSNLDNDALWRVARSRMPVKEAELMEELHFKRRYEGLSEAEIKSLNYLVEQYERYMLSRAEAAVLLKERGVDISELGELGPKQ